MVRLTSFEDLEGFVREVLCLRADLDLASPLFRNVLKRKGRPCGVEFTLVAPRSVRLSAIWESFSSRVLFYDQNLDRFQVTQVAGISIEHLPGDEEQIAVKSMWKGR
ncbi:hypothetical protein K2Y11_16920 [bacterium]|nr:hypothetical protein [bacterium]